jgi:hypothetical protein
LVVLFDRSVIYIEVKKNYENTNTLKQNMLS